MRFPDFLIEAQFIERANRFACWVEVNGRKDIAYLPNSGRLRELLTPKRQLYIMESLSASRRTRYNMILVSIDGLLVSVDARLPNELFEEGLKAGRLEPFTNYSSFRREVAFGHSRLDFQLQRSSQLCYVEIKSITLVERGVGLFPDAPTLRGRQHLINLMQARNEGHQAAIVFIIQRHDVAGFSPNDITDSAFGVALRQAQIAGVGIHAYRCQVTLKEITIETEVPVFI